MKTLLDFLRRNPPPASKRAKAGKGFYKIHAPWRKPIKDGALAIYADVCRITGDIRKFGTGNEARFKDPGSKGLPHEVNSEDIYEERNVPQGKHNLEAFENMLSILARLEGHSMRWTRWIIEETPLFDQLSVGTREELRRALLKAVRELTTEVRHVE